MTQYDKAAKRRIEYGSEGRKYGVWGKDFVRDEVDHRSSPIDQEYDTLLFVTDTTFTAITDMELPVGDQDAFIGKLFIAGSITQGWFKNLTVATGDSSSVICYKAHN